MLAAVFQVKALLLGVMVLALGTGLLGSLLAVRASLELFSASITGVIMTGYSLGIIAGSLSMPRLISRVGHVRVFAALASLASVTALAHPLVVDPYAWFLLRVLTGFSMAGVYVSAESWLNGSASNEFRGQILSAYLVVQMGGFAVGQFLLNVAPAQGFELFIISSILLSLALIPILLSATPAPAIVVLRDVKLKELYVASPLGMIALVLSGVSSGVILQTGAVFASAMGFTVAGVSTFMAAAILGCTLLQWPLGWLSDKFDRRIVMTVASLLTAAIAFASLGVASDPGVELILFFAAIAGLALPMYGLCIAQVNDYLSPEQMIGASGTLLIAFSAGQVMGPLLAGLLIDLFGNPAFILLIGLIHGAIGLFALWRMSQRAALPLEAQGPTIAIPMTSPSAVATVLAQEASIEITNQAAEEAQAGEQDQATDELTAPEETQR